MLKRNSRNPSDIPLSPSPRWSHFHRPRLSQSEKEGFDTEDEELDQSKGETDYSDDDLDSLVRADDFSAEFFRSMLVRDEKVRESALKKILQLLKESFGTIEKRLIEAHLGRIVRFAYEVPFKDVEIAFQKFLKLFEKDDTFEVPKGNPSPSFFMPKSIFPPVDTDDKDLRKIFIRVFLRYGRVSHLHRILALHPSFHIKLYNTYDYIMVHQHCPIPVDWRIYISILVSARFQCQYLVQVQESEFAQAGGDRTWLKGLEFAPTKIQNLMVLIELMCHQPWRVTKNHIASLVKGNDSWSIGEIVHAMTIICTFKALAGVALGCGVTPEVDFLEESADVADEGPENDYEDEVEEEGLVDDDASLLAAEKILEMLQEGVTDEGVERAKQQQESIFFQVETTSGPEPEPLPVDQNQNDDFSRYRGKYQMQHKDFDVRSKEYAMFKVQDYNWKEHGFELLRRYLAGAADLLDEEFEHIYNLTYHSFGKTTEIDTARLRIAVWQYVQRVNGMFHDDYDYSQVNKLLNVQTKSFIKKVICYPEKVTAEDWAKVGYDFHPSEKVHVALLSVESSRQSELLYALHAVMNYMTG